MKSKILLNILKINKYRSILIFRNMIKIKTYKTIKMISTNSNKYEYVYYFKNNILKQWNTRSIKL